MTGAVVSAITAKFYLSHQEIWRRHPCEAPLRLMRICLTDNPPAVDFSNGIDLKACNS